MILMTWFLEVLCAQQEEVYVTHQLLWGLEAFSTSRLVGYFFFQESIFLSYFLMIHAGANVVEI